MSGISAGFQAEGKGMGVSIESPLTIALSKGRIFKDTLPLLLQAGIEPVVAINAFPDDFDGWRCTGRVYITTSVTYSARLPPVVCHGISTFWSCTTLRESIATCLRPVRPERQTDIFINKSILVQNSSRPPHHWVMWKMVIWRRVRRGACEAGSHNFN